MDDKTFEWKIDREPAIHIVPESHSTDVIITRGKFFTPEESGCQHLNSMVNLILHGKIVRHHMLAGVNILPVTTIAKNV